MYNNTVNIFGIEIKRKEPVKKDPKIDFAKNYPGIDWQRWMNLLESLERVAAEWDDVRREVHRLDQRAYRRGDKVLEPPGEPVITGVVDDNPFASLRAGDTLPADLVKRILGG